MNFTIPSGNSRICQFDVYPTKPVNGSAQEWRTVCTDDGNNTAVDTYNIVFSEKSTPEQRLREQLSLVFQIADEAQTETESWRFAEDGIMYCNGGDDYLDRIQVSKSKGGSVLTLTIHCLSSLPENFSFRFIAMQLQHQSGKCKIYASADPNGSISRD